MSNDIYFPYTIWCINLVSRNDRYERAKELFNGLGLNVEFFRTEKHSNPIEGCFNSHKSVITESYRRGDEYCLIFEDDLELASDFNIENFKYALSEETINNLPTDWNLYYLGCRPDVYNTYVYNTNQDNIYHLHAIWTHAYIISRKYMVYIINLDFKEAIDTTYCKNDYAYAYLPSLILQGASDSDIGNSTFSNSFVKKWMYDLDNYYAMSIGQPMSNYIWIPILIIILIIIGIVLLVLYYLNN